jgi:hypothetical protein
MVEEGLEPPAAGRVGVRLGGKPATLLKEESTERHRREVLEKARVLHRKKVRHKRGKAGHGRLAINSP